jgi:hypothetical protein
VQQLPPGDFDDPAAAATPFIARAAGGALMLAGLDAAIMALQLWGFRLYGWIVAAPFAWLALGLAALAVGFGLQRGRGWAAVAGVALALVLAVGGAGWALFGLSRGFVSLGGLALPPLAGVAIFLTAFAVEPALRVTRARRKLQEQGLGLGV